MRHVSPPLVPAFDVTVYIILDDFGKLGHAFREVAEEEADRESVVRAILQGQYENPQRVIAFNTAEGWSRDVSEDIAREVCDRAGHDIERLPAMARGFIERHIETGLPAWMR